MERNVRTLSRLLSKRYTASSATTPVRTRMNVDSFYEARAEGIAGALCRKCGALGPAAEFNRKLTKAQSKALGYTASVALVVESLLCRACQPRRKKPSELSIKELHNRGVSGDIHPVIADELKAKRRLKASHAQSQGAHRRWQSEKGKLWQPVRDALTDEIKRCVQQSKHAKKAGEAKAALRDFLKHYLGVMRYIRNDLDSLYITHNQPPRFANWQDYVDGDDARKVWQAWEAVPLDQRMVVRVLPSLITYRPERDRLPAPRLTHISAPTVAELPSERRAREEAAALAKEGEQAQKEHSSLSSDEWLID